MGYKQSILVFSIMVIIISVQTHQMSNTSSNRTIGHRSKRYLDFIPLSRMFVSNCDAFICGIRFLCNYCNCVLISFVRTLKTTFRMAHSSLRMPTDIAQTIQLRIAEECAEVMCTIP